MIIEGDVVVVVYIMLRESTRFKLPRSVKSVSEENVDAYVDFQMNVEEVIDANVYCTRAIR
ncbi:MAG: hypothetical protein HUJ74_03625 [Lachnospiraceae bacterium]|nr:hypothetical protein [Lachnospiraceae bacterium]